MYTDPIADLLTRIRNGILAQHRIVEVPASKLKLGIVKVLFEQGYINAYKMVEDGPQGTIKIALKYNQITKTPAIQELKRVSRPGLRRYVNATSLPRIKNGLGVAILTTSQGVISDKEAREKKIGGELLCYVF
jgi:small subunit ribosomal protein S8